jgi:hypothetical protein
MYMYVKKGVFCCKFLIFSNCNVVQIPKKFPQAPFKKLNILRLVIYMVHDYSFFGSPADVVIKKEHLGFLSDLAISKRHRRRVEIACGNCYGNLH